METDFSKITSIIKIAIDHKEWYSLTALFDTLLLNALFANEREQYMTDIKRDIMNLPKEAIIIIHANTQFVAIGNLCYDILPGTLKPLNQSK